MDEFRALRVIAALRSRGVNAQLYEDHGLFGVRVSPAGEREAGLDTDGATGPDAGPASMPGTDRIRSLAGVRG